MVVIGRSALFHRTSLCISQRLLPSQGLNILCINITIRMISCHDCDRHLWIFQQCGVFVLFLLFCNIARNRIKSSKYVSLNIVMKYKSKWITVFPMCLLGSSVALVVLTHVAQMCYKLYSAIYPLKQCAARDAHSCCGKYILI